MRFQQAAARALTRAAAGMALTAIGGLGLLALGVTTSAPVAGEKERPSLSLSGSLSAPGGPKPGALLREVSVRRVIDGDTFVLGDGARVRVRNFDTPERRGYACPEEKRLAEAATRAARRLLAQRRVRLSVTGRDRYGRLVADVEILGPGPEAGADFAERMVAGGYGAFWNYGHEPQPEWCGPPA